MALGNQFWWDSIGFTLMVNLGTEVTEFNSKGEVVVG